MNDMHECEIKSFSKTYEFNPDLPKNKIFNQFVLKNSKIKHILHQNQGTYNLGRPKQIHIQYHVQSLAKNNLCSVCT